MNEHEIEAYLQKGLELLEIQKDARDRVRESWRKDASDYLDMHFILVSAISAVITIANRTAGKFDFSETSSKRMAIHAALIQGIDLTEVAISEGLVFQAAALIRQQMYAIESLKDIKSSRRRGKHTRLNFLKPMSKLYGQLSELAKLCTDTMNLNTATAFVESRGLVGPSTIAQYESERTKLFYGVSCLLLFYLVLDMIEVHENELEINIGEELSPMLIRVAKLLHQADIIDLEAMLKL